MTFSPTVTVNVTPALTVQVADSGVPPVTYNQVKQSMGSYVYLVKGFYVYSTSYSQLIGVINYQRYNSDGNQNLTNIATTVDPYQGATAIKVDLKDFATPIVFNGNSSIATTILANTYVQIQFYTARITNSFGENLNNFLEMEKITGKHNFFDYGKPDDSINKAAESTAKINSGVMKAPEPPLVKPARKQLDNAPLILLSVAAASFAMYLFKSSKSSK